MLVSPTAPTTAFKLGEKLDDPMAMYLNDLATIPANLAGVPGISVPSGLADEDGLPAGFQILAPALADDRLYRVGAALEALLLEQWGGPLLDQGPRAGRSTHGMTRRPWSPSTRCSRVRPGPRPRGARRAQHHHQDVLRLPGRVRRRAQHPGLPDLPRPARRDAGGQRARPSSRRSGSASRSTARSPSGAGSPGRTTSTRTCRRTSRPRSTTSRSRFEGYMDVERRRRDRSASRSSARTWRRTPASRCTSAARPAASTAPTTRWSTTTAPASR